MKRRKFVFKRVPQPKQPDAGRTDAPEVDSAALVSEQALAPEVGTVQIFGPHEADKTLNDHDRGATR
jgi:hypothetical protein